MKHDKPSTTADFAPSPTDALSIYVHWPYCQAKCPYCDFNSHVTATIAHEDWREAYLTHLRRDAARIGSRRVVTVFFGGGTPSLMDARTVAAVLDEISRLWPIAADVEVTLEANPTSTESGKLAAFRTAGVNRVSIGVQSLRDSDLAALGRRHTSAEALAAVEAAHRTFGRVNMDLIYARQGQRLEDWTAELEQALSLGVGHLSLYQLTIEPGTAFAMRASAGKLPGLPSQDLAADMYEATQTLCDQAGFPAYEISNHSRPGQECQHNLAYWTGGDYLGVGPGAHGRITREGVRYAEEAGKDPRRWLLDVKTGRDPVQSTALTDAEACQEYVLMGLRTASGVDIRRYPFFFEAPVTHDSAARLVDAGLLELDGHCLRTTPSGRPLLDSILREICAG